MRRALRSCAAILVVASSGCAQKSTEPAPAPLGISRPGVPNLAATAAPGAQPACAAATPAQVDPDGLELLANVRGMLEIELSQPLEPIAPGTTLQNQKAPAQATINALRLVTEINEHDVDRPLTKVELDHVVFRGSTLRLQGNGGPAIGHDAPDCKQFTLKDVLDAIESTERQTRGNSEWFDGIDAHHVFFEGIRQEGPDRDVWRTQWGS